MSQLAVLLMTGCNDVFVLCVSSGALHLVLIIRKLIGVGFRLL